MAKLLFLSILSIVFNQINCDVVAAKKPLIDFVTVEYLNVEQNLWYDIEHQADKRSLYGRICDAHERFFYDYLGETGIFHTTMVDVSNTLKDNLRRINSTFDLFTAHINSRQRSSLDQIVNDAANSYLMSVLVNADNIAREVIRADFWKKSKDYETICLKRKSSSDVLTVESEYHLIYNNYKDIRAAFLKSYIIAQLSLMLITIKDGGDSSRQDSLSNRDHFISRNKLIKRNIDNLLKLAKRDTWNCDPSPLRNPRNYEQITKFLQGYIDNDVNLNNVDTCTRSCSDYKLTASYDCHPGTLCASNSTQESLTRCFGSIRDCYELDNSLIEVCHTNNSIRRYNYLKYDTGEILGTNTKLECDYKAQAQSWRRWLVKCNNCFCLCDDPTNSDRFFSLREVNSDIKENKVVTGVGLVKENRLIQLVISQRTLLPYAQTRADESNIWKLSKRQFNVTDPAAVLGRDYHALNYENRSIAIHSVEAPENKAVTGVRFRVIDGVLTLQIRVTDFSYHSGQLEHLEYTEWLPKTFEKGEEIVLEKPGNPILSSPNIDLPNSGAHRFIKFGPTDVYKDASQLTVPFIDNVPVEPGNPVVLSGVGLYHRGHSESGGFIAPKLLVYGFQVLDPYEEQQEQQEEEEREKAEKQSLDDILSEGVDLSEE